MTAPKGSVEEGMIEQAIDEELSAAVHERAMSPETASEIRMRLAEYRTERDALKGEVERWKSLVLGRTQHMNEEHDRAETAEASLAALKEKWGPVMKAVEKATFTKMAVGLEMLTEDSRGAILRAALAVREGEGK